MKKTVGYMEVIFDISYLLTALMLGLYLLYSGKNTIQKLAGVMAIVLVSGDSFHLLPRVLSIIKGDSSRYIRALGIGKLIASITMTVFYSILWYIAVLLYYPPYFFITTIVVNALGLVRILLCLFPQNKWTSESPPVSWGVIRNIPFVLQGLIVIIVFWINRSVFSELSLMWLAITLSFIFYIPVVLWANKNPKIGMLMLPKTIMYVWIVVICLNI